MPCAAAPEELPPELLLEEEAAPELPPEELPPELLELELLELELPPPELLPELPEPLSLPPQALSAQAAPTIRTGIKAGFFMADISATGERRGRLGLERLDRL